MKLSSAFLTDKYELTMVDSAIQSGTASRKCTFEVFARRLPGDRKYGVFAGTGRLLELINNFYFSEEQIEWLESEDFLSNEMITWLKNYKFTGNIRGYTEGDVFFNNSPVLQVEGSFAECCLLETLVLSVLNYDSAVATAASRMITAANGRPVAEMGSRRTNENSAVAAARAAYIAGFSATSNLEAGYKWAIPTMGTAAHAFTLLHDNEIAAFKAQVSSLGNQTTLLIDTYNIFDGVKNAVAIAGKNLGSVRIDSGDLPVIVAQVRELLDSLGNKDTKITVTNDLDEHALALLASSPVDSYGVGTSVVIGSGAPTMGMVYKMVERENSEGLSYPVNKNSVAKASIGGKKYPYRKYDKNNKALSEHIMLEENKHLAELANYETLFQELVINGECVKKYLGPEGVQLARKKHSQIKQKLPVHAFSLNHGEPAIDTIFA